MSDVKLTKDSDALICVLYKEFLQRRKSGMEKSEARCFDGAENIQQSIMQKWSLGDVENSCWELSRAGLLSCKGADDTVYFSELNNDGVIYMENRFKNGLNEVLNYIEKFRSILP